MIEKEREVETKREGERESMIVTFFFPNAQPSLAQPSPTTLNPSTKQTLSGSNLEKFNNLRCKINSFFIDANERLTIIYRTSVLVTRLGSHYFKININLM